jgi:acetyltransferase-like isoleucine patch superfamily enzyme
MQKKLILLPVLLSFVQLSFSQQKDSIHKSLQLKGAITITNKGISFVPTFTLGKPAAIFNLSLGKRKLFVEPELRFSLKGRPWAYLFWVRYKPLSTGKFQMNIGTHLGLNHRYDSISVNGTVSTTGLVVRRYLAGELAPNYFLSKNVSIGGYYMYSRGIDKGTIKNTHFVTINSNISNIKIGDQFYARINPQLYYLALDARDGLFITSSLNIYKRNFPISFQSIINKSLDTDIAGSEKFLWNVSLIYAFDKTYVGQ